MNVTFERATAADVETLVKLQIAAFHDDARVYPGVALDGPPGYDSVEATLTKMSNEAYYKILADEQIVGGVGIFDVAEGVYHLDIIYIDPAYHNRGIGSQTIEFIERTYPAKKWTLDTPDYATRNHHFYEKFGYVMIGKEVLPDIVLRADEKNL